MTQPQSKLVEAYRKAIREADPAAAAKAWRAAQGPEKESERNAMIQTLDFSQVESYSFAEATGDLATMAAIWIQALNAPDGSMMGLLKTVSNRNMELSKEEEKEFEESEEDKKRRNLQNRNFLNELLARSLASRSGNSASPKAVTPVSTPPGISVSELLSFATDEARRAICSLTNSDIETLKSLGHLHLPETGTRQSMKQWANKHHARLDESQIERIHKASLLFQNRMIQSDATMLAMAARSARGKKAKETTNPEGSKGESAPKGPSNPEDHPA